MGTYIWQPKIDKKETDWSQLRYHLQCESSNTLNYNKNNINFYIYFVMHKTLNIL